MQNFTVYPLGRYDVILEKPWLTRHNPEINFQTNEVTINCEPFTAKTRSSTSQQSQDPPVESLFISGRQARHALRPGAQGYLPWVTADENDAVNTGHPILTVIKNIQQKFSDVIPAELPDELPPKKSMDHDIKVEAGSTPQPRPAYRF